MTPTSLNEASLELQIMSDLTGVPVDDIRGIGVGVRELPEVYDAERTTADALSDEWATESSKNT